MGAGARFIGLGTAILTIPVQGDLEEGQLSLLATSDMSKLQVLVGNFSSLTASRRGRSLCRVG